MSADTPEQLEGLRRAGRVVAQTIEVVKAAVAPGVSTGELDQIAADYLAEQGARSGPILTYGYPGAICISVDDEVVHGLPGPAPGRARQDRRRRRARRLSRRRCHDRRGGSRELAQAAPDERDPGR